VYNGVLIVDKEKGYTSHDVVAKLRGILHMKKIGHTGTLDPDAEGVLPICLGSATRLCEMLTDKEKVYETVLLLGKDTDTQDINGVTLSEQEVTVSEEEVKIAAESFVGTYLQTPPMYSALKVNGRKLYELAREGKVIERKARPVEIKELVLLELALPEIKMRVRCSKGTYIRTLCHDIGEKLGCMGCMKELVRTRVSCFERKDAVTLKKVEQMVKEGRLEEIILKVDQILEEYPACMVKKEADRFLYNGNPLFPENIKGFTKEKIEKEDGTWVRVYDDKGAFVAIYEYRKKAGGFWPVKMFTTNRGNR